MYRRPTEQRQHTAALYNRHERRTRCTCAKRKRGKRCMQKDAEDAERLAIKITPCCTDARGRSPHHKIPECTYAPSPVHRSRHLARPSTNIHVPCTDLYHFTMYARGDDEKITPCSFDQTDDNRPMNTDQLATSHRSVNSATNTNNSTRQVHRPSADVNMIFGSKSRSPAIPRSCTKTRARGSA